LFLNAFTKSNNDLFDYGDLSSSLRSLRTSAFGAPFLTFTYKVIPSVLRASLNNPHKLLAQAAAPAAVSAASLALLGDFDDEEKEELHRLLPDYVRNSGTVLFLPWRDDEGNPEWIDASHYYPHAVVYKMGYTIFANMASAANSIEDGEGILSTSIMATLKTAKETLVGDVGFLGGFILSSAMQLYTNADTFGRKIIDESLTLEEQLSNLAGFAYNAYAPSLFATQGPLINTANKALFNDPYEVGSDTKKLSGERLAGNFIGIKTKPLSVTKARVGAANQRNRKANEIRKTKAKVARVPANTQAAKTKKMNQLRILNLRLRRVLQSQ
jgi:hypothetical protein